MSASGSRHVTIAPGLLAADSGRLTQDVAAVGVDWLNFDIMDGGFVPKISFGPPGQTAFRRHTGLPFDVHLTATPVDGYLDTVIDTGGNILIAATSVGRPAASWGGA